MPSSSSSSSSSALPWSPLTCLPVVSLTPSGLLQLDTQDQEVELVRRGTSQQQQSSSSSSLLLELRWDGGDGNEPMATRPKDAVGPWKSRHGNLAVTVTTHRLIFQDVVMAASLKKQQQQQQQASSSSSARFVHLSNVHQVTTTGGPTLLHPNASHKVVVSTYTYGDFLICSSQKSDKELLEQHLTKALGRKQWEMATRLQEQQLQTHTMTRRRVGVDHILTKHKLKHQQAQKVAQEALSGDAEQLLQQASALLQVIQKYTTLLQQQQQQQQSIKTKATDDDNGDELEDQDALKLSSLLQDMGMVTNAMTKDQFHTRGRNKKDADRAYYEWLARQVVDFLWTKLSSRGGGDGGGAAAAGGGVMSLTDVYCLYNRARGTNLISPEDLRKACDLLDELNLGISQRTFDSGIVVLQMDHHRHHDHATGTRSGVGNNKENDDKFSWLQDVFKSTTLPPSTSTTALEASHILHVSPILAMEYLKEAEQAGRICRDTTLESTRFFPNRFDDFVLQYDIVQ